MAKETKKKKNKVNNEKSLKGKTINTDKKVTEKSAEEEIKEEDVSEIKEAKKETIRKAKRQLIYSETSNSDELTNLIKIVLIVVAIIVVFYGITVFVTKKANEAQEKKNNASVKIQYDDILIGEMLNMDGSYYVLIEKSDDSNLTEYKTLMQSVKANTEAPTIYTTDLSNGFNKKYIASEPSYDSDLTNFKVTGTVLVKISDHKIENTYDTYETIKSKLQELE
jgi:hypothetical protein